MRTESENRELRGENDVLRLENDGFRSRLEQGRDAPLPGLMCNVPSSLAPGPSNIPWPTPGDDERNPLCVYHWHRWIFLFGILNGRVCTACRLFVHIGERQHTLLRCLTSGARSDASLRRSSPPRRPRRARARSMFRTTRWTWAKVPVAHLTTLRKLLSLHR